MQRRSVVFVAVRLYDDLHIPIERHEKAQKPFNVDNETVFSVLSALLR
jgi:hypothetical protein